MGLGVTAANKDRYDGKIIKALGIFVIAFALAPAYGCAGQKPQVAENSPTPSMRIEEAPPNQEPWQTVKPPATTPLDSYINPAGETIKSRINVPEGYERKEGNAYEEFIRNQKLMPDGSPVLLYDGEQKGNQNAHIAVLSIDVGERDRQQCADAALRLRCEYLFSSGQYERINYHLTNGDEFPYAKYREGYRLKVNGNKTTLEKTAQSSTSYESFRKYCDVLFAYAGTISVDRESTPIEKSEMRIGDIFVIGGSPGHCVMVMDICKNAAGEKLFLLGQSYMPAQQIHILKNFSHQENPWYELALLSYPFETPEWIFEKSCLKRMP